MIYRNPEQGFSLVELLVVIAIISILATLLLPTMERGLEMGRRTACINNMKQVGIATMQFAEENNRCLPNLTAKGWGYGVAGLGHVTASDNWGVPIQTFSKLYTGMTWKQQSASQWIIPDLFICPSLSRGSLYYVCNESYYGGRAGQSIGESVFWGPMFGYASLLGIQPGPSGGLYSYCNTKDVPVSKLTRASSEVLMADLLVQNTATAQMIAGKPTILAGTFKTIPHGQGNRPDGTNQAFADGSVRWYDWKTLNYTFAPGSYTFDRRQFIPYYAAPTAAFNRGGYPHYASRPPVTVRWYGIITGSWGGMWSGMDYMAF